MEGTSAGADQGFHDGHLTLEDTTATDDSAFNSIGAQKRTRRTTKSVHSHINEKFATNDDENSSFTDDEFVPPRYLSNQVKRRPGTKIRDSASHQMPRKLRLATTKVNDKSPAIVYSQPYMPSPVSDEISTRDFMTIQLLAKPPEQSPPTITQEDQEWADEVMKFDPKLNRFRYTASNPSRKFSAQSHLIVGEAFKANISRLNSIRDEDYEFIGVIADVTPNLVKSCFQEWSKTKSIPEYLDLDIPRKEPTVLKKNTPTVKIVEKQTKDSSPEPLQELNEDIAPKVPDQDQSLATSAVTVRKIISPKYQVLQKESCKASRNIAESCRACIESAQDNSEVCQFENFRYFYVESPKDMGNPLKYKYGPDFFSDPSQDPNFRFYKIDLNRAESDYILSYIHQGSRDLLKAEIKHVMEAENNLASTGNKYVRRPSQYRQHCELCEVSIVSGYWMCCVCGQDICLDCFDTQFQLSLCLNQSPHHKEQFVPCSRFHLSTLVRNLESLYTRTRNFPQHLVHTTINVPPETSKGSTTLARSREKMEYLEPLISHHDNMTIDMFRESWRQGRVILLSGIGDDLKSDWSPKYLKRHHGNVIVTTLDIGTQEIKEMKLGKYFDEYFIGQSTLSACKMMEWPMEPFQELMEGHFVDLLQALPVPDYTRLRGVFNLVDISL